MNEVYTMSYKNNIKYILIIVFFISISVKVYAQANTISGQLIDTKTGKPLVGASVFIKDTKMGSITNTNGLYSIDLSKIKTNEIVLIARNIGYYEYSQEIKITKKMNIKIDISLKESSLMMDQIVVTGTRTEKLLKNTPVTTQVIHKDQIQNSGGMDISDVFSELTGIVVQNNTFNNGINSVELQGLSSEHVLILIDGMKVIGRVNGELDVSQIPISEIERVEIVKGAASTLYGSEAMGGVINIITKNTPDCFTLNANSTYGSYGRLDGNISTTIPIKNWVSSLNLNYRTHDGYDLNNETVSQDAPAYNKYQGRLTLKSKLDDNIHINMETLFNNDNSEVVSSSIFKDKISNDNLAMRVNTKFDSLFSILNIETSVEYSTYKHNFDRVVLSSGYLKKGSLTSEQLYKAGLLFDTKFRNHQINGGYAIESESLESDRILNKQNSSVLNNIFIQDEFSIIDWLTIVGGLRCDVHSKYGYEISPKLSMMLKTNETSRIRLSYGQGFRAPSFKELYFDYTNTSIGYHIIGNTDLKPEVSNAIQLDFEFWNNSLYHSKINFFFNNIENLIDYKYIGIIDEFGTYVSTNLNFAKTWGGEIDIRLFPSNWFSLTLGYSYLNTWNATTKTAISLKPNHRINTSLSFELPYYIKWNIRGQYIGKKFYWEESDETTMIGKKIWINDYYILHSNLNIPLFWGLIANIGMKNIMNYYNKQWGPMPGREWYAGIRYKF